MYEQKGAFSDISFFQPIHQELQEQMNAEVARVLKATDLGRNSDLLTEDIKKFYFKLNNFLTSEKSVNHLRIKRKKADTHNRRYRLYAKVFSG